MIRREGRTCAPQAAPVAAACLVSSGIRQTAMPVRAAIRRGSQDRSTCRRSSLTRADHHHSAVGQGAVHCLSGPGCISAAVLPDAAVLVIGKSAPALIAADLSPHRWDTLPPLHPPNFSNSAEGAAAPSVLTRVICTRCSAARVSSQPATGHLPRDRGWTGDTPCRQLQTRAAHPALLTSAESQSWRLG